MVLMSPQPESQPGQAVPQWSLLTGAVAIPVLSWPTNRYQFAPPTPVPAEVVFEHRFTTTESGWSVP